MNNTAKVFYAKHAIESQRNAEAARTRGDEQQAAMHEKESAMYRDASKGALWY